MPTHKAFFPEAPSKTKYVNETVTIPQPVSESPITIKSNYKPRPKAEIIQENDNQPSFKPKTVTYAPPPVILPKKNIFFNMY